MVFDGLDGTVEVHVEGSCCARRRLKKHLAERLAGRPSNVGHRGALHARQHLVEGCDLEGRHQNACDGEHSREEEHSQAERVGDKVQKGASERLWIDENRSSSSVASTTIRKRRRRGGRGGSLRGGSRDAACSHELGVVVQDEIAKEAHGRGQEEHESRKDKAHIVLLVVLFGPFEKRMFDRFFAHVD